MTENEPTSMNPCPLCGKPVLDTDSKRVNGFKVFHTRCLEWLVEQFRGIL